MSVFSDPIARQAAARPDALAVLTPETSWSYAELDARVGVAAHRMQEGGIAPGDRVAVYARRSPALVATLWALWRGGAVAALRSTRLPATEALAGARHLGASALITDADDARQAAQGPSFAPSELVDAPGEGLAATPVERAFADDTSVTVVYTSGSTGTPKGALHTWGNHAANARGSQANIALEPGDRWLASLPVYHVGGLAILVRCALAGAAVALPAPETPLWTSVQMLQATHLSCVATQLQRGLRQTDGPVPASVRALLVGGSSIPDGLIREAHRRGWPIHTTYGCTEMASQIATTEPGASLETLRTSGRVLPERELRIAENGEIEVRGATLFAGYLRPDGLDPARTPEGWYRTGDVGYLDAEGRLHVTGRTDRMFISGGENIHPEEIEAALERLDGIDWAAVVAVPDDEYGARPVAFVQTSRKGKEDIDLKLIRTQLRAHLPGFKLPDAVYELPDAALTSGLKVDRSLLERRARELRRT